MLKDTINRQVIGAIIKKHLQTLNAEELDDFKNDVKEIIRNKNNAKQTNNFKNIFAVFENFGVKECDFNYNNIDRIVNVSIDIQPHEDIYDVVRSVISPPWGIKITYNQKANKNNDKICEE